MWHKLYSLCRIHHLRRHAREIMAISAALMMLIAGFLWMSQPRLVVVDMMRAIHVPAQMLARSRMPDDKQAKLMARYSTLLPEVMKAYGQTHHVTVMGATVFFSQRHADITNIVIQQTLTRLKSDE